MQRFLSDIWTISQLFLSARRRLKQTSERHDGRRTECQDEEELQKKKDFLAQILALGEKVTCSLSVFISTNGSAYLVLTVRVLQDLRGEKKKGANCSKLSLRASRRKQQDCDRRGQRCKSHDWL